MSTLTHEKILQVINKFMNFTSKNCACEVSRNYKNPITDETQKKPINCCYTCMTMGILMTLYLLNGDILLDIENFPKNIKLPKEILKENITYDKYFLGITNSIGLLWDIHCLLENPFIPCGVEIALNDGLVIFCPPFNTPYLILSATQPTLSSCTKIRSKSVDAILCKYKIINVYAYTSKIN